VNEIISMTPNQAVRDDIAREVQAHHVVLFMKGNPQTPRCGFSARVCSILGDLGIPYHSRDVLRSSILRDELKSFSNWPTFPQLYVGGQFVGGCDIVTELYQSGELGKMLSVGDSLPKTPEDVDYRQFRCGIPRH
jgi:monothiol glutaredoxin